jgi:hypothetical protein
MVLCDGPPDPVLQGPYFNFNIFHDNTLKKSLTQASGRQSAGQAAVMGFPAP